jgi:hypothetical protein
MASSILQLGGGSMLGESAAAHIESGEARGLVCGVRSELGARFAIRGDGRRARGCAAWAVP